MTVTPTEALSLANQCYRAGQYPRAVQFYEQVLVQQPDHAPALHMLGVIALQTGDPQGGVTQIGRALACDPTNVQYWNNYGFACCAAGKLPEAVRACEQALRLQPDLAEAHNNLGIALERQGDLDRAATCYAQAIRYRPANPEAFSNLGNVLRTQGKLAEAKSAHEQALGLRPTSPEVHNNLGITFQETGELGRAARCYRQALRLNPQCAEAHNNLGLIFKERGKHPRAVKCFRRALTLQPGYVDASNNLATALKEQGLLDEALAQVRETLRLQPTHPQAWYNLSQFAREGKGRFGQEESAWLRRLLAEGRGSHLERSLLCFTLADFLDRQGSWDEAFGYYQEANTLRQRHFQGRTGAFDSRRHQVLTDRAIATFDRAFFRRAQDWGTSSQLPVFVVGMPRSGSTLVEQILSTHSRVFGAGELTEIPRLAGALGLAGEELDPSLAEKEQARDQGAGYLRKLARLGRGADRVIDKYLGNYQHLGVIAALFPQARVIHCRRDPLDTCLSCFFQSFQDMHFSWSLTDLGHYFRHYEFLMNHWRQVLPLPLFEVHYEELVADQEGVTRKLLAFCGLDWEEGCLRFFNNRRPVQTASTLQVRRPLSSGSIGRWKRYRTHLQPLIEILGLSVPKETTPALSDSLGADLTNHTSGFDTL